MRACSHGGGRRKGCRKRRSCNPVRGYRLRRRRRFHHHGLRANRQPVVHDRARPAFGKRCQRGSGSRRHRVGSRQCGVCGGGVVRRPRPIRHRARKTQHRTGARRRNRPVQHQVHQILRRIDRTGSHRQHSRGPASLGSQLRQPRERSARFPVVQQIGRSRRLAHRQSRRIRR